MFSTRECDIDMDDLSFQTSENMRPYYIHVWNFCSLYVCVFWCFHKNAKILTSQKLSTSHMASDVLVVYGCRKGPFHCFMEGLAAQCWTQFSIVSAEGIVNKHV